jgi:bacteriocin-like protein
MKGTIMDFLNLAAEKPELAHDLLELATKHDFEFTVEELSDDELDSVSGGVVSSALGGAALTEMTDQNLQFLALQQNIQNW